MSDDPMNYPAVEQAQEDYNMMKTVGGGLSAHMLRNPPVRKVLEQRIAEYEKLIQAHKDALAALDAAPNVETVLNTLRKLGI